MNPLRDYLLDVYGGFADRRHKDPALDRPIKVDDQGSRDIYPGFCTVFVSVPDRGSNDLILKLHHAPLSAEVIGLLEEFDGTIHRAVCGPSVTLTLKASQGAAVRRLAKAIRAIVGRGRSYDDPNLRWICPRTAASLERLAEHLGPYREELRPDPAGHAKPAPDPRSRAFLASPWAPSSLPPGSRPTRS